MCLKIVTPRANRVTYLSTSETGGFNKLRRFVMITYLYGEYRHKTVPAEFSMSTFTPNEFPK